MRVSIQQYFVAAFIGVIFLQVCLCDGQESGPATTACAASIPGNPPVVKMCYDSHVSGSSFVSLDAFDAGTAMPLEGTAQCKCTLTFDRKGRSTSTGSFGISKFLTESTGVNNYNCGTKITIDTGSQTHSVRCLGLDMLAARGIQTSCNGDRATFTLTRDTTAPPDGYKYGYCWGIFSTDLKTFSIDCDAFTSPSTTQQTTATSSMTSNTDRKEVTPPTRSTFSTSTDSAYTTLFSETTDSTITTYTESTFSTPESSFSSLSDSTFSSSTRSTVSSPSVTTFSSTTSYTFSSPSGSTLSSPSGSTFSSPSESTFSSPSGSSFSSTSEATFSSPSKSTFSSPSGSTFSSPSESTFSSSSGSTFSSSTGSIFFSLSRSTFSSPSQSTFSFSTGFTFSSPSRSTFSFSTGSTFSPSSASTVSSTTDSTFSPTTETTLLPTTESTFSPTTEFTFSPAAESTFYSTTGSTFSSSTGSTFSSPSTKRSLASFIHITRSPQLTQPEGPINPDLSPNARILEGDKTESPTTKSTPSLSTKVSTRSSNASKISSLTSFPYGAAIGSLSAALVVLIVIAIICLCLNRKAYEMNHSAARQQPATEKCNLFPADVEKNLPFGYQENGGFDGKDLIVWDNNTLKLYQELVTPSEKHTLLEKEVRNKEILLSVHTSVKPGREKDLMTQGETVNALMDILNGQIR